MKRGLEVSSGGSINSPCLLALEWLLHLRVGERDVDMKDNNRSLCNSLRNKRTIETFLS